MERKIRKISKMKDTKIIMKFYHNQNSKLRREISNESYWLNLKIVFFFRRFREINKAKLIFRCLHRRNNPSLIAILSFIRMKKSHLRICNLLVGILLLSKECRAEHNKTTKIHIFRILLRIIKTKKLTHLHNQILIRLL